MNDWLVWAALIVGFLWFLFHQARKRRKEQSTAQAAWQEEDQALVEREGKAAILIRDKCRYARNFAADMLNTHFSQEERDKYREKYEETKSWSLVELLGMKDEFCRCVATHGVIDLLVAGNEPEKARSLFATLDDSLQDLILSTDPEGYRALRA